MDNSEEPIKSEAPNKLRRLTIKQQRFIKEYVKEGNGSKSVRKAYGVKDNNKAKVMASQNLTKLNIQEGINKLLQASEYDPKQSISNLIAIEQAKTTRITGADKIKASEMLLKLSGFYREAKQSTNVNYNFTDDSAFEFIERTNKLRAKREGK